MRYQVRYDKSCLKYLKRLDKVTQKRIIAAINKLPDGDVKRLIGTIDDYRLRVGEFRVLFNRNEQELVIWIIQIASRGDVYKHF